MAKCEKCGKNIDLPFICNYCKDSFCIDHRLPESHNCPNLIFAKSPTFAKKESNTASVQPIFSSELQQLLITWLVLSFCFSVRGLFSPESFLKIFVASLATLGLGFIGHELAHRYVARKFGCWAEFRLWPMGLIMALILALISGGRMIFAAPGAVYIIPRYAGLGYGIGKRENGLISISGPITNVVVAMLFLIISSFGGIFNFVGLQGFFINLWLAAFNLIPFGNMDGQKILRWNPIIWALITIPVWVGVFFLFF